MSKQPETLDQLIRGDHILFQWWNGSEYELVVSDITHTYHSDNQVLVHFMNGLVSEADLVPYSRILAIGTSLEDGVKVHGFSGRYLILQPDHDLLKNRLPIPGSVNERELAKYAEVGIHTKVYPDGTDGTHNRVTVTLSGQIKSQHQVSVPLDDTLPSHQELIATWIRQNLEGKFSPDTVDGVISRWMKTDLREYIW